MIYEHACDACKIKWDVVRNVDQRNDPLPCAQCGGETRRVITSVPVIFADSGFPGNDMKPNAPGGPRVGRKMSFKEQEYVAKNYPESLNRTHPDDLMHGKITR
jgi:putative FmdB family regulatory protein